MLQLPTTMPLPLRTSSEGTVYVGASRVTLETVIGAYLSGSCAVEIVHDFDTLQLSDVHAVLAFYESNRQAVTDYLDERERASDLVRAEHEDRTWQGKLRDQLLARQKNQEGAG